MDEQCVLEQSKSVEEQFVFEQEEVGKEKVHQDDEGHEKGK